MMKYLDKENWDRKEHFELFSSYQEPYWGVTVNIDVTLAKALAKSMNISFYFYYLHKSLLAANSIAEFKYRIDQEKRIEIYDDIHASSTLQRKNGTFGFSQIAYSEDLDTFLQNANAELQRVENSNSLFGPTNTNNVIFYSALPWVQFTSLSHARNFEYYRGIPMISFGKLIKQDKKFLMPLSIHVHHGLVDGLHVGKYIDVFQEKLNS